jgi:hypothetical protein
MAVGALQHSAPEDERATSRSVYLPVGSTWTDAWTDEVHEGRIEYLLRNVYGSLEYCCVSPVANPLRYFERFLPVKRNAN